MASDFDMRAHRQTWHSFTILMKWTIGLVVVTLGGMAYFLL